MSGGDSYLQDSRNPNPLKFEIEETDSLGHWLIVKINYIGCTNFEGRKILVYRDLTAASIRRMKEIDPHFIKGSKMVARFAPTEEGMALARKMVKFLDQEERDEASQS